MRTIRSRVWLGIVATAMAIGLICYGIPHWNLAHRKYVWAARLARCKSQKMQLAQFIRQYGVDTASGFTHSGTRQVEGDDKYSFRDVRYIHRISVQVDVDANGAINGFYVSYYDVDVLGRGI